MAYQSLYRRYRPQRFSEIRGQNHLVAALRNAVATDRVGHAYMFHGPRGTGKTSAARVLAKALNCERLGNDSEPCGSCESCVAIEQGRSFDLHELDAASNNGVEDMRDLLSKVNLGNPGKMKVYILDEVHMLTRGAENSLLKTLEEPPGHVVWVLATTEPHKVVETIRSRCQVLELGLLGADEMTAHVLWVIEDAGLEVDDSAVDYVVSVGGGSVRDTLSTLDRVVAAGGVVEIDQSTDRLLQAFASQSTDDALTAVDEAMARGRDPRTIAEMLLAGLRDAFLTLMGSPPPRITVTAQERASEIAAQTSPIQLTRALETLGTALVEMRQAPDPRVHLEVALVRLCRTSSDSSVDSLLERIEQLEARLAAAAPIAAAASRPALAKTPSSPVSPATPATPATAAERASKAPRKLLAFDGGPKLPPAPPLAASARRTAEEDIRSLQPNSAREVVELASMHLSLGRDLVVTRANSLLGPREDRRSSEDLQRLWRALVNEFSPDSLPDAPAPSAESPDSPEAGPVEDPSPPAAAETAPTGPDSPEAGPVEDPARVDVPNVELPDVQADDARDDTGANNATTNLEEIIEVDSTSDADGLDLDRLGLDKLIDASSHTDRVVELLSEAFPGAEIETPSEANVDQ